MITPVKSFLTVYKKKWNMGWKTYDRERAQAKRSTNRLVTLLERRIQTKYAILHFFML